MTTKTNEELIAAGTEAASYFEPTAKVILASTALRLLEAKDQQIAEAVEAEREDL